MNERDDEEALLAAKQEEWRACPNCGQVYSVGVFGWAPWPPHQCLPKFPQEQEKAKA